MRGGRAGHDNRGGAKKRGVGRRRKRRHEVEEKSNYNNGERFSRQAVRNYLFSIFLSLKCSDTESLLLPHFNSWPEERSAELYADRSSWRAINEQNIDR